MGSGAGKKKTKRRTRVYQGTPTQGIRSLEKLMTRFMGETLAKHNQTYKKHRRLDRRGGHVERDAVFGRAFVPEDRDLHETTSLTVKPHRFVPTFGLSRSRKTLRPGLCMISGRQMWGTGWWCGRCVVLDPQNPHFE